MIEKIVNPCDGEWHAWFAWHSVSTICGHRVWWERIERRWNTEKNFRIIDICDPGDYDGGWDYRLTADAAAQRQEQEGGSHG